MANCLRERRQRSPCSSSARCGAAADAKSQRKLFSGAAQKPTALIVPTAKESDSDTEADTDMDVKGYHPFETFIYTKPCKPTPPVQVEMPETPPLPPPPPHRQQTRLVPPQLLAAAYSREDVCGGGSGCCSSAVAGGADDRSSSASSFSSRGDRDSSGSYFGTGSNVTTIRRGPPSPEAEGDSFPPPPPPPPPPVDVDPEQGATSSM